MFYQPLEQFELKFVEYTLNVRDLFHFPSNFNFKTLTFDLFFSSTTCFLFLISIILYFFIRTFSNFFVSSNPLLAFSLIYDFVLNMVLEQLRSKMVAVKYFPLLFVTFCFILLSNIIGLIPGCFTITSQILVTFTFSFSLFIGIVCIGLLVNKNNFILLFIPKNVPVYLMDFLFLIEFVSYVSRTFSLAIRLFANMLSGHALIFILSGFVSKASKGSSLLMSIPQILIFSVIVAVCFLEIGIALLQAYVFIVLTIIYLNDSYNVGH